MECFVIFVMAWFWLNATESKPHNVMSNLMRNIVIIFTFFFLASFQFATAQTFEKSFLGWWGDTMWEFHFSKNGRYKRISSGHYGFTTVKGKYKFANDTIQILSGFENTHGTVNEYYIIDENDILIDLSLGYGHPKMVNSNPNDTISLNEIRYPEIQAVNKNSVIDMQSVLNMAFNSKTIKDFYHFDSSPPRKFIIANYYKLNVTIYVDGNTAIFKNKNDIDEKFYIEFEKLTCDYDRIYVVRNINAEGVQIVGFYVKKDGEWIEDLLKVTEK